VSGRGRTLLAATAAALLVALLAVVGAGSASWIGRTFPGFLLMANRVVPSIALPAWADGRASELFQHQVVAVDGVPVTSAAAVYAAAGAAGPGRALAYMLRAPSGAGVVTVVETRTFTAADYAWLFGAYLLNGLLFGAIGLLVVWIKPRDAASWGFASAMVSTSVFVITAADLYGPHVFFRLHAAAEVGIAAGFLHLALVFPVNRIRGRHLRVLTLLYGTTAVAILAYEAALWDPTGYTIAHLGAVAAQVVACAAMIGTTVHGFACSRSPLVRRRVGVVALGALGGLVLPLGVWATAAVLGGGASMNGAALTAFFFPLALAYAVLQADLFEIDVVVRRATTYAIVVTVTAAVYVGLLALAEALRVRTDLQRDPVLLVASNVALLFLLAPIRDRVQDLVDGIFFRRSYDPQRAVARLGLGLERALQVREVVATTRDVLHETFFPRRALLLAARDGCLTTLPGEPQQDGVRVPESFVARLASGQVLTRYAWEDGSGRAIPAVWAALDAELLVPVRRGALLEYVLVLAGKESGRAYNLHDAALVQTIAGQVSLAMATASAFEKLESMNARLEGQVAERTKELGRTNVELRASLDELNEAYFRLEQSQKSLLRADRLATLGRLAAGIAHEINTPLAAVRNSLALLHGLGREYADSIADAQVTPDDHRQIAGEIVQTVATAESWAQRAATSIGRIKTHGREPGAREPRRFQLAEALDEVSALLDHRLRAVGCRLEIDAETRATALVGDVGELTHMLLNVVDNAIGAYEDLPAHEGRIALRARGTDDAVVLEVRDWATGIAPEVAPHVFDEMFTTKERGKGTGLGLWIARNIVEKSFSGALDLVPIDGSGACFRARLAVAPSTEVRSPMRDAASSAAVAQKIFTEGRTSRAATPENQTPALFGR